MKKSDIENIIIINRYRWTDELAECLMLPGLFFAHLCVISLTEGISRMSLREATSQTGKKTGRTWF